MDTLTPRKYFSSKYLLSCHLWVDTGCCLGDLPRNIATIGEIERDRCSRDSEQVARLDDDNDDDDVIIIISVNINKSVYY